MDFIFYYFLEMPCHIIFDCGASDVALLEKRITFYLGGRALPRIDLLALSHLHYDHVSGLPYLLSRAQVDTVVLPYISPLEKLLIAAAQPPMPPWYYSFLASPATFLASFGVRNIYFLGGGGEGEAPPLEPGPPSLPPEARELASKLRGKIMWHGARKMPSEDVHEPDKDERSYLREKFDTNVEFVRAEGYATFTYGFVGHLILIFFVKPVDKQLLDRFHRCLKSMNLIVDANALKTSSLLEILMDISKLRKLKKCYRCISRDINLTSLSLGITTAWSSEYTKCYMVSHNLRALLPILFLPSLRRYTWPFCILLTGDTRLDRSDVRREFMKRYRIIIENMTKENSAIPLIFQAPHHGSIRGFNRQARIDFTNRWGAFLVSVVSYKWPRRISAFEELRRASVNLELCHQERPVSILISVFE